MPTLGLGGVPGTVFVNCVLEGMPVRTPYGDVPIENLQIGDLVYTKSGIQTKIVDTSVDFVNWNDIAKNENKVIFKIPAGQLGARQDAYISYWHRLWHKEAWRTAASLGLARAKKEEVCPDGSEVFRVYNLALEYPDEGFLICGGLKVESWSGKIPRVTGGFRMHNGLPAMINA